MKHVFALIWLAVIGGTLPAGAVERYGLLKNGAIGCRTPGQCQRLSQDAVTIMGVVEGKLCVQADSFLSPCLWVSQESVGTVEDLRRWCRASEGLRINAECAAVGEKTNPIIASAEVAFVTGLAIVCTTQIRLSYINELLWQQREQDAAALYNQGVALGECRELAPNTMVRETNVSGPYMRCVLNQDDPPESHCLWVSDSALTELRYLHEWCLPGKGHPLCYLMNRIKPEDKQRWCSENLPDTGLSDPWCQNPNPANPTENGGGKRAYRRPINKLADRN